MDQIWQTLPEILNKQHDKISAKAHASFLASILVKIPGVIDKFPDGIIAKTADDDLVKLRVVS